MSFPLKYSFEKADITRDRISRSLLRSWCLTKFVLHCCAHSNLLLNAFTIQEASQKKRKTQIFLLCVQRAAVASLVG